MTSIEEAKQQIQSKLETKSPMNFEIPPDIFNDILYLQKSLRHHIQVHQMLATSIIAQDVKADITPVKSIENEIRDIGVEQKTVLNRLRLAMEKFFITLENSNVSINRPEVNAYIAKKFSANNQLFQNDAKPINVKKRLTEAELIENYKVQMQSAVPLDTASENLLQRETIIIESDDETVEKVEILMNPRDIAFPTAQTNQVHQISKNQVSLLKPKSERVSLVSSTASVSVGPQQPQNVVVNWKAPMKVLVVNKMQTSPQFHNNVIKMINFKGPVLTSQQQQQLQNQQQRLTAKMSNVSDTNKQFQTPTPIQTPTPTMTSSRMNLLQALNKAKKQSLTPVSTLPPPPTSVAAQTNKRQTVKTSRNPSPISSDDASSSSSGERRIKPKPKLPINTVVGRRRRSKSPSPSSSSTSFDGPDLPDEDEEPTVLGKEAFMRLFGLCTHTYKAFLTTRRSERKRRNVTSTEKGDFHYGKIDTLFEQYQASKNNKRMLLNSPPATRTLKRKRKTAAIAIVEPPTKKATAKSKSSSGSSASSISSTISEEPKMCMSCLASSKEKLFECDACNSFFHVTCHNKTTSAQAKTKEKFCPDCLRRQPKSKESNQQRGSKLGSSS